jgi:hypothetical protein
MFNHTGEGESQNEDQMNVKLEAALDHARRGRKVFPCHSPKMINGQCGCDCAKGLSCPSPGKHPRTPRGVKDASAEDAAIRGWWTQWPDANIGLATGTSSGVAVLDVDPRHGGDVSLAELQLDVGSIENTETVSTGGGGLHLYFSVPSGGIGNSAGKLGTGLDVRGDGGYVIAPPGTHVSGGTYAFEAGKGPGEIALAPFPGPLLQRLSASASASLTSGAQEGGDSAPVMEGGRNDFLASIAGTMVKRGISLQAIEAALLAENCARCLPPLSDGEVRRIVASISRYQSSDTGQDDPSIVIGNELPADVRQLLADHKRLQTLFSGEGKLEFGWDGRRLDQTPVGYDFSVALALVRKGITDPSVLATALACRPDRHARGRGRVYIASTVKAALAHSCGTTTGSGAQPTPAGVNGGSVAAPPATAAPLLGIQKVRVYKDPGTPRFELDINGNTVSFTAAQLLNLSQFRVRYFEQLCTLPQIPTGRDAQAKWASIVEGLGQSAEVIDLPPDATSEGALLDAVRRAIKGLQIGESVDDLDDGKGFAVNGKLLFKTDAIVRQVKATFEKPKIQDVGRHLSKLGLEYKTRRYGPGKKDTVRAWQTKLPPAYVPPTVVASVGGAAWPTGLTSPQPGHPQQAESDACCMPPPPNSDYTDFGVEVLA